MRRIISVILAILMVLSMVGCTQEITIVGTWEEEIMVSVLGATDKQGTYPALLRYTFAEDGTGTREIFSDIHPEEPQTEEFAYSVDGEKLIMTVTSTSQGAVSYEYTIQNLTADSLELYFYGRTNSLKRAE